MKNLKKQINELNDRNDEAIITVISQVRDQQLLAGTKYIGLMRPRQGCQLF